MVTNFVADIKLEDEDEVLSLPVVRSPQCGRNGAYCDTLENYLVQVGRFFGKDTTKWEQVGEPKVEIVDEGSKRIIKKIGMFAGVELHLSAEMPFYDQRLPVRPEHPDLVFNIKSKKVNNDAEWQEIIADQPWPSTKRRQLVAKYLQAKMMGDTNQLQLEGVHGMYELAVMKEHHADITLKPVAALLQRMSSPNPEVVKLVCATIWMLAATAASRRLLADQDVMALLMKVLRRTISVHVLYATDEDEEVKNFEPSLASGGKGVTEEQRNQLQGYAMGALSVLIVDSCCRQPLLALEPRLDTLFQLCQDLDGYNTVWATSRRSQAAKLICALVQRDPGVRHSLVDNGMFPSVIKLLLPEGVGASNVQFCMANLLAQMVLDDESMQRIKDRGQAVRMFDACLALLNATMRKLVECPADLMYNMISKRRPTISENGSNLFDPATVITLCEALAQGIWGAAYSVIQLNPVAVTKEQITMLGNLGQYCLERTDMPLGRVCHSIAATLSTFASNEQAAKLIGGGDDDNALQTLLHLMEVTDADKLRDVGHVQAAACSGIAFLALHPIGAKGDECLVGPHRAKLLEVGAFGGLLRAALMPKDMIETHAIVEQAAAVGLMYLATMAGPLEAAELAMYAALLTNTQNVQMVEFLMAGMWILLRNPHNRQVLGMSFQQNPAMSNLKMNALHNKIHDAIEVHDVQAQAQEQMHTLQNNRRPDSKQSESQDQDRGQGKWVSQSEATHVPPFASKPVPETFEPQAVEGKAAGLAEEPAAEGEASNLLATLGAEATFQSDAQHSSAGPLRIDGPATEACEVVTRDGQTLEDQMSSLQEEYIRPQDSTSTVSMADPMKELGFHPSLSAPSTPDIHRDSKVKNASSKLKQKLEDNWGLETLVRVGENWVPRIVEMDRSHVEVDVALLKLCEFLTASMCLYLIDDSSPVNPKDPEVFMWDAAQSTKQRSWWTVDADRPVPAKELNDVMERAVRILLTLMQVKLQDAWKSVQLSCVTMWNAAARSPSLQRYVVEAGVAVALMDIANSNQWPASLRDVAGGFLQCIVEQERNVPHVGGIIPFLASMVTLINTRIPLLELVGARGIARACFHPPEGCDKPMASLNQAKAHAAELNGIQALISLIKRINKRYQELLLHPEWEVSSMVIGDDDSPSAFERPMQNTLAIKEMYFCTFAALLNLSTLKTNQTALAKTGLLTLLGTNTLLYQTLYIKKDVDDMDHKLVHLCSAIIQNMSSHPRNRTRMYKAELRGSVSLDKLIHYAKGDAHLAESIKLSWSAFPPIHPGLSTASRSLSPPKAGTAWRCIAHLYGIWHSPSVACCRQSLLQLLL